MIPWPHIAGGSDGDTSDGRLLPVLSFKTDSRLDSLGDARRRVRAVMAEAGVDEQSAQEIEVALGETLSNVHRHAYRGTVGSVRVELWLTDVAVTVCITDEGDGATLPSVPRVLSGDPESGGRGLYLTARLVDNVEIAANPQGNGITVRLTKRVLNGHAGSQT
jgi:anti-sigma regulatory factor (Ser/Thr protein kinase)